MTNEEENYWPLSRDELMSRIDELVNAKHDYDTSADAMWKAALLAFNYISSELGTTGFQAGFASLKFLAEVKHIKGPFAVIRADDMLFPQYGTLLEKVDKYIDDWTPYLAEEAQKKLDAVDPEWEPHPKVKAHWESLASKVED